MHNPTFSLAAARTRHTGFTLIEVMIVVAVIGILAAIAYPSYQESVTKTRRSAAQGCLVEMAQFMERFYTTNMRYDQTAAGVAVGEQAGFDAGGDGAIRFGFGIGDWGDECWEYCADVPAWGSGGQGRGERIFPLWRILSDYDV